MAITLDTLDASLQSIAIKDETNGYELSIDSNGYLTVKANGDFNVTATDLDIRDLTSASDSVEIKTAAGQALSIDGSGYITANVNGTVTVDATDLDIRDLTSASDSVEIKTAAGQALAIDGSGYITSNINGTVTVDATDLDIRDLAFATDSVTAHQGGSWSFTLDNISSWKNTQATVTSTVAEVVSSPLANRTSVLIQNLGTRAVYAGPDGSTTSSNGIKIPRGSSMRVGFDTGADIYLLTASGTADVRISEYASA